MSFVGLQVGDLVDCTNERLVGMNSVALTYLILLLRYVRSIQPHRRVHPCLQCESGIRAEGVAK